MRFLLRTGDGQAVVCDDADVGDIFLGLELILQVQALFRDELCHLDAERVLEDPAVFVVPHVKHGEADPVLLKGRLDRVLDNVLDEGVFVEELENLVVREQVAIRLIAELARLAAHVLSLIANICSCARPRRPAKEKKKQVIAPPSSSSESLEAGSG